MNKIDGLTLRRAEWHLRTALKLISRSKAERVTRQGRLYAKRIAMNLCGQCGLEPLVTKTLGVNCQNKKRDYMKTKRAERVAT